MLAFVADAEARLDAQDGSSSSGSSSGGGGGEDSKDSDNDEHRVKEI